MLLTLPTFDPAIPTSFRSGSLGIRQLKMALCMSRLGWLTDEDFASITDESANAGTVQGLLQKAWDRAIGESYHYRLASTCATLFFPKDGEPCIDDGEEEKGKLYACVAYDAGHPECIAGGRAFEALEAKRKGLGRTIIALLDDVLRNFGVPHTIGGVLEMCSITEWMGEENEDMAIEEYLAEGEAIEDLEIVHFDTVVDGVPAWAYAPISAKNPLLTRQQLQREAKRLKDSPLGKIIAAMSRLSSLCAEGELFSPVENEYEPLEPPIVIGWEDDQQFIQYIDSFHNWYWQGESPPWVGAIRMEICEQGIQNALTMICHTGEVFKALDEVLVLIDAFQGDKP